MTDWRTPLVRTLVPALVLTSLWACGDDANPPTSPDAGDASVTDADADAPPPPPPDATNPLLPRVDNEGCALPDLSGLGAYQASSAYPSLPSFSRPLWVGVAPGDSETLFVVEQGGTIYAFDDAPDVSRRDEFLSITVRRTGNEEGLLGLAFHPQYGSNGRFFVNYSSSVGCPGRASRCSVVSEFRRESARAADPSSERRMIVLAQPYGNHNGGDMQFGPDGLLYISFGDGGDRGDPDGNGQNTNTLLGALLRIDVDDVPEGAEYGIPATNPFADGVGGAPEVYAWGLRNVWRMSFDPSTGVLWAGDVGQVRFEEIDTITEPGNYGWNTREGFVCYPGGGDDCSREGLIDPVHAYPRSQGRSITGGVVYRGSSLLELWGTYLFADFVSGRVWGLQEREGLDAEVIELFSAGNVASFGYDGNGEVLIASFDRGILRLERGAGEEAPEFPEALSETGCFSDIVNHQLEAGVIPYAVNVPFWSDGLVKERYVAFPSGEGAALDEGGAYTFPVGTLFLKTFYYSPADGGPRRRLETRVYAHQTDGWRGFTWRWNEEQTDAILVRGEQAETLETAEGSLEWTYPSSSQCDQCHTSASGHVLAFNTRQLNRGLGAEGDGFPQLDALVEAGWLRPESGSIDSSMLPRHPVLGDEGAPIEDRARAWLDTNCAMCHQQGAATGVEIDLRASIPFGEMRLCGAAPRGTHFGIEGASLLTPGAPEQSVLLARVDRRGEDQMPPLGSTRVDRAGVSLLTDWVSILSACP